MMTTDAVRTNSTRRRLLLSLITLIIVMLAGPFIYRQLLPSRGFSPKSRLFYPPGEQAPVTYLLDIQSPYPGRVLDRRKPEVWVEGGISLDECLSAFHPMPTRVVCEGFDPRKPRKDFCLVRPAKRRDLWEAIRREAICEAFSVRSKKQMREMDAYVISTRPGVQPKLQEAATSRTQIQGDRGSLVAVDASMEHICSSLEGALGKPIFDETQLPGYYCASLSWKPGDTESVVQAVGDQWGLQMLPQRRSVEMIVVEKTTQEQSK